MEIKINITPEIRDLVRKIEGDVSRAMKAGMTHLVEEVEARAVKLAPVRTSNLVNSITSTVSPDGTRGEIRATAPYARYVHEGTGLFGPYKMLIHIKPKTKKALFWPGALHPVKSVTQKGQKPNPFFLKALAQIKTGDVFAEGMGTFLKRA